jgi:hypothetical protein
MEQIQVALAHRRNPVVTDNRPALEFLGFVPAYPQLHESNPCEWTRPIELDPQAGRRRLAIERVLLFAWKPSTSRTKVHEPEIDRVAIEKFASGVARAKVAGVQTFLTSNPISPAD